MDLIVGVAFGRPLCEPAALLCTGGNGGEARGKSPRFPKVSWQIVPPRSNKIDARPSLDFRPLANYGTNDHYSLDLLYKLHK